MQWTRVIARAAALSCLAGLHPAAIAQEAPHVWPAPGLYGLDRTVCGHDDQRASATAEIAPTLCPYLDNVHRNAIGSRFAQLMLARFPGAEANFAAHLPAGTTARARLAGTLIASLRLSRATIWTVSKPGGDDGFLPITLTLDIVNAATGEVVFSRHVTKIAEGQFANGSAEREIASQFPRQLDQLMLDLVADAASNWHPDALKGFVIDEIELEDGKAWVINKGRLAGLRAGDGIGADGHVLHAGASYALVRPTLGIYHAGDALSRTLVSPAQLLARPSVLVSVGQHPGDMGAGYLAGIFEDAIAAQGMFAAVPVTPAFAALRTAALGEAGAVGMDSRALPDFVAGVDTVVLPAGHFPSAVPGISTARFEAHVFVSLVDRTGRIVAAFHGTNRIEDKIAQGMAFSDAQRQDTVLRNALFDAAQKMASWHPKPGTLAVSARDGAIWIDDPANALPTGTMVPVLRNFGPKGAVREDVRAPVAHLTTQASEGGGVVAFDADPLPYHPRNGDIVPLDAEGPPLASRGGLAQCLNADGGPEVADHGSVPVQVWGAAAEGILALHGKWPIRSVAIAERLAPLKEMFAGWDRFAPAQRPDSGRCFIPLVQATPGADGVTLGIGYRIVHGNDAPVTSGLGIKLRPAAVPVGTSVEAAAAQLQVDLAHAVLPLAEQAAARLTLPPS